MQRVTAEKGVRGNPSSVLSQTLRQFSHHKASCAAGGNNTIISGGAGARM